MNIEKGKRVKVAAKEEADELTDFIYNQHKIPKEKWRYSLRSSAATGCGWIATYNALHLMGHQVQPEKLIRYYECQVPLLNGNLGTFILGPALYFKQKGFRVKVAVRRSKFDEMAKNGDACVLFYFWRRKYKLGAHFITVSYQDGKYVGYNTFRNSVRPDILGESLEKFLKRQKYILPILTVIGNKGD